MKELMIDEHAIAASIRKGDITSFTKVYETYHAHLFRFALRFLKSAEHAEECVFDVFLKLWENRERLTEECSLKGYLIKVCKNHILNLLIRAGREQVTKQEVA